MPKTYNCPECEIIQGEPRKGFERYYCKHIGDKIHRQLSNYSKKITEDVIKHTVKTGGESEQQST